MDAHLQIDRHYGWQDVEGPEGGGDLDAAATCLESSREMSFLCLALEGEMAVSVRGHTEASGTRLLGSQATDSLRGVGHDHLSGPQLPH